MKISLIAAAAILLAVPAMAQTSGSGSGNTSGSTAGTNGAMTPGATGSTTGGMSGNTTTGTTPDGAMPNMSGDKTADAGSMSKSKKSKHSSTTGMDSPGSMPNSGTATPSPDAAH